MDALALLQDPADPFALAADQLDVPLDAAGSAWRAFARPDQLPPPGDWRTWLILAGRRWGKSRTGAETIVGWSEAGLAHKVAAVGQTAADSRDILADALCTIIVGKRSDGSPLFAPRPGAYYEPSKMRVSLPGGAVVRLFSAEDPDALRGYGADAAWLDEVAAWRRPEAYDQAQIVLSLGQARQVVTTTPRPVKVIRDLIVNPRTIVTRGRTVDNAANLSPAALEELRSQYEGTRIGRQELEAELLEDVVGALWEFGWIDAHRVKTAPELVRVVVAVDPATTSGDEADETAVAVAGKGVDGEYYVLACDGYHLSPNAWALRAVDAYDTFGADKIVAEINNGGEMVIANIRRAREGLPVRSITASRGKTLRAEPISNLYEQGRVHHVGNFGPLEDQMVRFPVATEHDDRVDALVYALTELSAGGHGVLGAMQEQAERIAAQEAAGAKPVVLVCAHRFRRADGAIGVCGLEAAHEGRHAA